MGEGEVLTADGGGTTDLGVQVTAVSRTPTSTPSSRSRPTARDPSARGRGEEPLASTGARQWRTQSPRLRGLPGGHHMVKMRRLLRFLSPPADLATTDAKTRIHMPRFSTPARQGAHDAQEPTMALTTLFRPLSATHLLFFSRMDDWISGSQFYRGKGGVRVGKIV
jgi:hypothetical protein